LFIRATVLNPVGDVLTHLNIRLVFFIGYAKLICDVLVTKPAVYRYVQELVGESTSLEVGIG
jgi:hypothetical protein